MFPFWFGPLCNANRNILGVVRAYALICWVVVASLGGILGEGIWTSCQTARHIPVETEKREDMDTAKDLQDLLNNPEHRGKLDGALIVRLQEIIRDAPAQDVLPVRVQISEDLSPEGRTCLTDAGLSIQARVGDVLNGTIRTTDLRRVLFCKGLVGVALCQERELEATSRRVQPCDKNHLSPLASVPERSQSEATGPTRSKLDAALISLLQTKGEGAEPFRAALSETLDVDLDRPDPLVGVLIRVKGGRIKQLLSIGFAVHTQIGDVVTAKIPIRRLEELAGLSDVVSVEASVIRDSSLGHSTQDIRADKIPVELEKRDDMEPAKDLKDLLNDTARRGKLDGALLVRLQEIIKDGPAQDVLPVRVRISEDLSQEIRTCLGDAGLFIQAQVGNVLTGTIQAKDLRQLLFCNKITRVTLAENCKLNAPNTGIQP